MVLSRRRDGFEIDVDPDRIDVNLVHRWLSTDAYWAIGRSRDTVEQAIRASVNFGVYASCGDACGGYGDHPHPHTQVAYARVVTDRATFAWLCDVYVDRAHRGVGLGVWLVEAVRDFLAPYPLSRVLLATKDAHPLYAKVGFTPLSDADDMMALTPATPPS